MDILKRLSRWLFYSFFVVSDVIFLLLFWFIITVTIKIPSPPDLEVLKLKRTEISSDFYTIKNNWIKKSENGLWEIYIEGDGFERGVIEGKLNKELAEKQEVAFVGQLKKMIPSQGMLNYLKFFIAFFNRNLDQYIPDEYKLEIYGESLSASDQFDFIGPKYYRMLNYHAAHDIGHALQDKNMVVGCTSFGAWGGKTNDSTLLIGRNFDFYVGDAFAEDKLINFVKPKNGYKLMMISWAGMIGTVSGMNEKGLTVTINASKSEIPTASATPISILAREILQYAKSIDEAFAIAKKSKTFVSESILIGSLEDHKSSIIEKTPSKTELYNSEQLDFIICSNHFQSKGFQNNSVNLNNIEKSSSNYRLKHLTKLVEQAAGMTVENAVSILRNRKGMNEENIGMGNEKSLNQLIAHHSVVFKPAKLQMWVSTNPFQLGQFVCYDLNKVFAQAPLMKTKKELYEKALTIPADRFMYSREFRKFNSYKQMREAFQLKHKQKLMTEVASKTITTFISLNPEYFETYYILGNYYSDEKNVAEALKYYNLALTKEITTVQDKEAIEKSILEIQKYNR